MDDSFNLHKSLMEDLIRDISEKKQAVINAKLKKLNIAVNIDTENRRLFKSLVCVTQGNQDTYYYNDGSINGLRIVTFVKKETQLFDSNSKFTMKMELDYY